MSKLERDLRASASRSWKTLAAPLFVWIVLAAMWISACVFVARYSSSMPMADDLEWAEYVDPSAATDAEWWWSAFNEHRIPLPRVFFLALVRTTHDIRSGMYFDVCLLGGAALASILVVRRLRGRTSYSDAVFPLLWLTCGNVENLLMMHSISLILPSAITCALLLLFAASPDLPSWRKSLAVGLCLFSLPLCGAPGVTPAPALSLWCVYAGWKLVRSDEARARSSGRILLASAVATTLLLVFYFRDFDNPASAEYSRSLLAALRQGLGFLTLGFGPAGREFWPLSGWVTAAVISIGLAILVLAFKARPSERVRIAGLLAVAAGILSMALATGIARGGGYEYAGFALRYVTLPAPLLSCLYLAFCLYGPAAVGQFMRVSLYSLLLLCFFFNLRIGTSLGELHAREANAFRQDIAKGLDVRQLAVAHWWSFYSPPDAFEAHLESLRKVGFGPMAHARPASNDRHY
ncbi:MAG TPA: hypothetical protein VM509_10650, partial [Planctomycetota bacterium]|nr:hypothetical protein [Planctomycetota bacterium]